MLIKDLPKEIKELALKRQQEAGNTKDEKKTLARTESEGSFDWCRTPEGTYIWDQVCKGNFDPFYEKYPQIKTPIEEIEVKGFSDVSQAVKSTTREEQFEGYILDTLESLDALIVKKGREYRRDNNPFHNFERGSVLTGRPKEEVLQGFLLKHLISAEDMRNDAAKGLFPTTEKIHEKYNDILVYFMLEKAMMLENAAIHAENLEGLKKVNSRSALDVIAENYG